MKPTSPTVAVHFRCLEEEDKAASLEEKIKSLEEKVHELKVAIQDLNRDKQVLQVVSFMCVGGEEKGGVWVP